MTPRNILILCTGNFCRSQLLGEEARVYLAGVEVHGLHPHAVRTMAEDGVDISQHTSNHVNEYAQVPFDYVLAVCDHANQVCPVFSSLAKKLHHNFPDSVKATGSEEEIRQQFRHGHDQVEAYAQAFATANF